ncbi:hypothetical protein [Caulobacter sp. NIBR1757]|uniref:hypothetical protein n=1 Tax=Caulobacter sp. NIBR1757 TaxID=3016000 RepID=UPI0022F05A01|nr:hypothetical protein [Caulobacter sp. NIBR1757]WGM38183.1 hypothetical protein AMEJIAPC_01085 [Caulobacter sp. NIBR1757]
MKLDRRSLFATLAGAGLAAATPAMAQEPPKTTWLDRLKTGFKDGRLPVAIDLNGGVSGAGWDWLLAEGAKASFFAFGEEHGMAQVPVLVRELAIALKPDRLVLEISPPIAQDIDQAARGGVEGLKAYYRANPPGPAFYTMADETRMLAAVRSALPGKKQLIWGLDYEVIMDRRLIARLKAKAPASAKAALAAVEAASQAGWATFATTKNLSKVFTFAGDPALIEALIAAWPSPDRDSADILETLLQTLRTNRAYTEERYFQSNAIRADFMKASFVRQWRAASPKPRILFKFGGGHMVRGRSMTEVYDIGNLLAETATLEGGSSFHLLVIPLNGGRQAAMNPTANFAYEDVAVSTIEEMALEPLAELALPQGSTLVDLRPLRRFMSASVTAKADARLARVVHGYDAILLVRDSVASKNL